VFFRQIILVVLIFLFSGFTAQNGITANPDWQIKAGLNQGFILIHRTSIGHLVRGYPSIYELNISKPTLGNKLWHLENNKPDIGISFQCIDFKNPQQLGFAYVLAPYAEIPLSQIEKKSRLVLRLCWGATYITKRFDLNENRKNIAIGSHLNSFVQFKWFWHFQLTKKLRFEPGFAFTHASNGKFKNPNLGLNVVSLNAGLNYLIPYKKQTSDVLKLDSNSKVKSKNEIMAFTAIGFNQREIATEGLNTFVFSLTYQRNLRNTHKFSAGVDVFYDQNYLIDYTNEFLKQPVGIDKLRLSARLGYSYNLGRISFPIELGYYAMQKANPDGFIVSRIGVRYYTASGLVVHYGLRTHFGVAYCFEYGLGYRFYIK